MVCYVDTTHEANWTQAVAAHCSRTDYMLCIKDAQWFADHVRSTFPPYRHGHSGVVVSKDLLTIDACYS